MDAYEHKTRDIIELFLSHRISLPQCTAALNAALAALIPTLKAEQLPRLSAVLLANKDMLAKEEWRGNQANRFSV